MARSDIPDTAGRKTRRRQATANRYAFHANAIKKIWMLAIGLRTRSSLL